MIHPRPPLSQSPVWLLHACYPRRQLPTRHAQHPQNPPGPGRRGHRPQALAALRCPPLHRIAAPGPTPARARGAALYNFTANLFSTSEPDLQAWVTDTNSRVPVQLPFVLGLLDHPIVRLLPAKFTGLESLWQMTCGPANGCLLGLHFGDVCLPHPPTNTPSPSNASVPTAPDLTSSWSPQPHAANATPPQSMWLSTATRAWTKQQPCLRSELGQSRAWSPTPSPTCGTAAAPHWYGTTTATNAALRTRWTPPAAMRFSSTASTRSHVPAAPPTSVPVRDGFVASAEAGCCLPGRGRPPMSAPPRLSSSAASSSRHMRSVSAADGHLDPAAQRRA
jgi:hypothetical protein